MQKQNDWGDNLNNRNQQVQSFLDTLTEKEIQDYIDNNKLTNKELLKNLNRVKNSKPTSHMERLSNSISEKYTEVAKNTANSYYKLGLAYIIAFVFECFYDDKYKINDIKHSLKIMIDGDEELKEFVYDIMKDF